MSKNKYNRLLCEACAINNLIIVSTCLKLGANINCFNGEPLHIAYYTKNKKLAKYLIEKGCNLLDLKIKIIEWAKENKYYDILSLVKNKK